MANESLGAPCGCPAVADISRSLPHLFLYLLPLYAMAHSLFIIPSLFSAVSALNNGLALTPQMGWNTWNHFGCGISEDTILGAAKTLVSSNLTGLGYNCECSLQEIVAGMRLSRTLGVF